MPKAKKRKLVKVARPARKSSRAKPKAVKAKASGSEKYRQTDDRFRLLVEAVETIRDYGIFMLDSTGKILTWNLGASRIKGYSEKEVLGKHFSLFYTDEDRARNHPGFELKEAKKMGRYEEEGWRVRKDGTRFWASVVITKLTDKSGNLMGFSKVTRDLTNRKNVEEALRVSEERFRRLVEGVKDYAIFMLDPEGRVASWNEGAQRIKGYTEAEIIGKHFSIFYPEDDLAAGKTDYELEEATLTGRFEDEGWRLRKDGTRLWANVVITAIRDKNKKLLGFTKVTRDLTEKKRAEDRLQSAYSDLERKVAERTEDLASANTSLIAREKALEEAVNVRDEFLSIASHELKTPVTSLKMQLQLLRHRTKPETGELPSAEKLSKAIDMSLSQVDRLINLIEQLLDVARAKAQKLSFHFERVDLRELIEESVQRLAEQALQAGCTVELDMSTPVIGFFDCFRLEQALTNLLTNAFKYGQGTKVRVSAEAKDGAATFIVRDEGPGISPDLHSRIFERFERGNTSRNISGLGLGLFITKQIVEGHNGQIRVESKPGRGASFIVNIPINEQLATAALN